MDNPELKDQGIEYQPWPTFISMEVASGGNAEKYLKILLELYKRVGDPHQSFYFKGQQKIILTGALT